MSKIGFVFAGQGSQYVGMGKDIYDCSPNAKELLKSFLPCKPDYLNLCFEGSIEDLSKTINTQPCIYAVSTALILILEENNIKADICAGFSLGELVALAYSGVYSFSQGFKIVMQRAEIMHRATSAGNTCMYAVVKLDAKKVIDICLNFKNVFPVNFNSPYQTVVACESVVADKFCKNVQTEGGRALKLNVSGGFHSPFMDSSADEFKKVLKSYTFESPKIDVYSNLTGDIYDSDVNLIKNNLVSQINHPVQWVKTINSMYSKGVDIFIEIGSGKVLSGLINKIIPSARVLSVEDMNGVNEAIKFFKDMEKINA